MVEDHVENLRRRRMLPLVELVAVCIQEREGSLAPKSGKVVMFLEHFFRHFGLPPSNFFNYFLVHYGLQPHHLMANDVL